MLSSISVPPRSLTPADSAQAFGTERDPGRLVSVRPNMMVAVERKPTVWAARMTSSHWRVRVLSAQSTIRTSSSRISAAVPGSVKPRRLQLSKEISYRHSQPLRTLDNFKSRKRVHVDLRHGAFHGATDIEIFLPSVGRVNTALHADLGCAALPSRRDAIRNFSHFEIVGSSAQVLAHLAF